MRSTIVRPLLACGVLPLVASALLAGCGGGLPAAIDGRAQRGDAAPLAVDAAAGAAAAAAPPAPPTSVRDAAQPPPGGDDGAAASQPDGGAAPPVDHPDSPSVAGLTPVVVHDDAELDAALAAFGAAYRTTTHYVELARGAAFNKARTLGVGGTAAAPLILRGAVAAGAALGEMSGRATIAARWTVAAPWIWLDRLRIRGSKSSWALELRAEHAHVTRCLIESGGWVHILPAGKHFRIGWNTLRWSTADAALDGLLIECANASRTVVRGGRSIKLPVQTLALAPHGGKIYRNDIFDRGPFDNPGGGHGQVVYVAHGIKKVYHGSDAADVDVEVLNYDGMWPIELSHNKIVTGRRRSLYLKHGGDMLFNDVEHRGNPTNDPSRPARGTFGWRGGGAALGGATLRMWGNRVRGATAIQLYASGMPDAAGRSTPVMDVRGNDWGTAVGEIGVPVKNLGADGGKNVQYDTDGARLYGNRGRLRLVLREAGNPSWPRWRRAHDVLVYAHRDPAQVDLSGPHNDGTCKALPALPAGISPVTAVSLGPGEVGCGGAP